MFLYKELIYHVLTVLSYERIRAYVALTAIKTETSAVSKVLARLLAGVCLKPVWYQVYMQKTALLKITLATEIISLFLKILFSSTVLTYLQIFSNF